jgi:predicted DNA-binding transcriptional regulator YafY
MKGALKPTGTRGTGAKARGPRRGRPPGGFTQHNRLVLMQTVLENHPEGLLLADLAGALSVSTRSVRRYLRELDKSTKLEAVETRPGGTCVWRIKPTERGRAVMLRRTQAYGLLAVRRAFDVMRGSALYDELDVVTRQLVQLAHRPTHLGSGDVASDTRLESRLIYAPDVVRSYTHKGAELDDLFRAVADLRVLSFRYDPASAREEESGERVVVHPYSMILYRGAVYAIGLDTRAQRVEAFSLDRIRDTSVADVERFALPNDFDVEDFIHGAFGVAPPAPRTRVLIEFDRRVADLVRAQRVHSSQRIAAAPDGRVRLSLSVPLFESVAAWVLGFGDAAKVIEPKELRNAVVDKLRGALGGYV